MYLDEFEQDLLVTLRLFEERQISGDQAFKRVRRTINTFAERFVSHTPVYWEAHALLKKHATEHLGHGLADGIVRGLEKPEAPSILKADAHRVGPRTEDQKHAQLEETAAKLLAVLEPLDGILEINGVAFMMLVQEVQASGVEPMALTMSDVALMLGKARVRYNRMEQRLSGTLEKTDV